MPIITSQAKSSIKTTNNQNEKINKNVIWIRRHLEELISAYLMTLSSVCKSL